MNVLIKVLKKIVSKHKHFIPQPPVLELLSQVTINNKYQIPYLAGYSFDGKFVYIDKRLPRYFTLVDGRRIDVYKYLVVHEIVEKWLEDNFKYKYPYAHEIATGFERKTVRQDNIKWDEYQNYMLKMVKKLQKFSEPIPLDLDTKPEKDSHDYYRYHKIEKIKELEKQQTKRIEADYHLNKLLPSHPLFHATPAAVQILAHNEGICSNKGSRWWKGNHKAISLTRDITWLLDGKFGTSILVLDRDQLKTRFKIEPLDALGYMSGFQHRKGELEERVYTDNIPVKYIKAMITLTKPMKKNNKIEYADPETGWPQTIKYIYYKRETNEAEVLNKGIHNDL